MVWLLTLARKEIPNNKTSSSSYQVSITDKQAFINLSPSIEYLEQDITLDVPKGNDRTMYEYDDSPIGRESSSVNLHVSVIECRSSRPEDYLIS
jgi:hypothetical protein